ncbi:MAG: 3-deoxy-manno-octulosonate cytidylyltransferase [Bacteroidota bacterium]|jgi:3-deoxy-manno-octulosonate cytidylyltransferase (CMP-KDO synthetase)|nr:3-deoxy-manno-octulosonate cytidylyltransferase [Bacteroidota bacterium]
MNTDTVIVIPARYASTRFPGKPLASIAGMPMIQHVWERCGRVRTPARLLVATDDARIARVVTDFGGEAMMTPPELASGSERVAWIAERIPGEMFVNVQGDEPLLPPDTVDAVVRALRESGADITTAACPLHDSDHIANPNVVKLVTDAAGNALYFSRAGIPFDRDGTDANGNHALPSGVYRKHIGIYAFRRAALLRFAALPAGRLEQHEKLEQLRALEHGMRIHVVDVPTDSQAVDTPADVALVEALMNPPHA